MKNGLVFKNGSFLKLIGWEKIKPFCTRIRNFATKTLKIDSFPNDNTIFNYNGLTLVNESILKQS